MNTPSATLLALLLAAAAAATPDVPKPETASKPDAKLRKLAPAAVSPKGPVKGPSQQAPAANAGITGPDPSLKTPFKLIGPDPSLKTPMRITGPDPRLNGQGKDAEGPAPRGSEKPSDRGAP